jgi:quinoprotein glucose dehydrogenase
MKVEERAVPKSDVPGEDASATQPFPAWAAMVPQKLTAADAWGPTAEIREWCRQKIEALRNDGLFTPPSFQGSLQFPGSIGGVNWGSAAWDPERNLLFADTNRTPYAMYREFLISAEGTPCNAPPWGALVAFDLTTGKLRWEAPLGEMKPGATSGAKTGTPNLGGPISTAGGLVFTAAAMDTYLRAFDAGTGAEVWKGELPASAQDTAMTYEVNGKQYVAICAGGHGKLGTKMGDSVVAFALP